MFAWWFGSSEEKIVTEKVKTDERFSRDQLPDDWEAADYDYFYKVYSAIAYHAGAVAPTGMEHLEVEPTDWLILAWNCAWVATAAYRGVEVIQFEDGGGEIILE